MATPDDHKPSFPEVVYQNAKDWLTQQQAFAKENKAAAPLTDVQRAFLEGFRPRPPIPDIGRKNYVGLLNEFRHANPRGDPFTFSEKFHDNKNTDSGNPKWWVCTVELSEARAHEPAIDSFPAVGFGLDAPGSYPLFPKKRDAKQYAAKCAVDWLIKQSLMPSDLEDVTFQKRQSSAARPLSHLKKQPEKQSEKQPDKQPDKQPEMQPDKQPETLSEKQSGTQSEKQPEKRSNKGDNGVSSPPAKRVAKETTNTSTGIAEVDDEHLPATQRVQALCHVMKLGAPTYILILADPSVNNVFDGHPDFGDDEDSFPEDLGRVEGVTGKENAKKEIAKKVLVYLLDLYQKRVAELESHTGTTSS